MREDLDASLFRSVSPPSASSVSQFDPRSAKSSLGLSASQTHRLASPHPVSQWVNVSEQTWVNLSERHSKTFPNQETNRTTETTQHRCRRA